MKLVFSSILLVILLLACKKESDSVADAILKAEHYMEIHPDSALRILQEISDPNLLTGKKQADYGLLMTQALDKNYKPIESDSLIRLAINYYKNSKDNLALGKAYFYYGRYLYETDEHSQALDIFLNARKLLSASGQYKLLGLLAEYIGNINIEEDWYDDALLNHKQALEFYTAAKDTLSISFALRNIGRVYFFKDVWDSVYVYYNEALLLAENKGLISASSILQELGNICLEAGDHEGAEQYMLRSIDRLSHGHIHTRYLSLGELNIKLGNYNKAEEYLRLSLNSHRKSTLSGAYNALSDLEEHRGNYKEAIEFKAKRDSINAEIEDQEKKAVIVDLQKKYENELLKNKYLQMINHRNNIILISIILFLLISVIAIYFYYRYVNNKKKVKEIENTICLNEKSIHSFKKELLEYSDTKIEHLNEIGELKGKIALLTNQNRDLTERLSVLGYEKAFSEGPDADLYVVAFRTLVSIKSGTLNRKLSENDIALQIKLFNFLYDDYADRLMTEFPGITKHEIELCCLIKLGFNNQELSNAFNNALESVRKSKMRLKNRLKVSNDDSLESFLANY